MIQLLIDNSKVPGTWYLVPGIIGVLSMILTIASVYVLLAAALSVVAGFDTENGATLFT